MARLTDVNRIISLERSAIRLINRQGYSGTTVAQIAGEGNVSAGYLYSHYSSKEDLVRSIYEEIMGDLDNNIDAAIESSETVEESVRDFLTYIFNLANKDPELIEFIILLVYEHTFNISNERTEKTADQCVRLLKKGQFSGEVNSDITPEDIFLVFISMPMKFIEVRLGKVSREKLLSDDIEKILKIGLRAVG